MRVTDQQTHQLALTSVMEGRARLQRAQDIALTGERVSQPSDDPAAAARGRLLNATLAERNTHRDNISYGMARLQSAESALAEGGNILARARELATAMANETVSQEQRAAAAIEVGQLREAMMDIINTKYDGEYVFANVATTTAPISSLGAFSFDVNTYDSVREVEVGPSQIVEIGASAAHAFSARTADPTSVDVVSILTDLGTGLTNNDPDAVRSEIDQIDIAFDQVLAERARTGLRSNRLQTSDTAATDAIALTRQLRSDLVEADIAEAFSNLSMVQTSMQAAVTVAGKILGPSLLDMM